MKLSSLNRRTKNSSAIRPIVEGLNTLFVWLGMLIGWMVAPVIISRWGADSEEES